MTTRNTYQTVAQIDIIDDKISKSIRLTNKSHIEYPIFLAYNKIVVSLVASSLVWVTSLVVLYSSIIVIINPQLLIISSAWSDGYYVGSVIYCILFGFIFMLVGIIDGPSFVVMDLLYVESLGCWGKG